MISTKNWVTQSNNVMAKPFHFFLFFLDFMQTKKIQKQPSMSVTIKRCSENMLQIYRRKPMRKCDFNKVALKLYKNHFSVGVLQ